MTLATMPTCRDVVEAVTDYLDGGLAAEDRLRFERHVVLCPPCRGYLAQMRTVTRLAGRLRDDELPDRVRADLTRVFADWSRERGGR